MAIQLDGAMRHADDEQKLKRLTNVLAAAAERVSGEEKTVSGVSQNRFAQIEYANGNVDGDT